MSHGLHRRRDCPSDREADLSAWQLLLTADGCFTGLTAAELWGLWLPPLPSVVPVFVALGLDDPRPLRDGVRTSRHPRPVPHVVVRGLRRAAVPETLLASARILGLLDVVVLVDSALHLGLASAEEIAAAITPGRRGGPMLRRALELSDGRSESPWETWLRILHHVLGAEVEPQWELRDDQGVLVARADLRVCGTTSLHEYDGADHDEERRRVKDLRRHRRIDGVDHVRRGYTSGDILHRPVTVLRDIDRALGRPHDPGRVRAWHDLLRESTRTPAGQAWFLRRLETRRRGGGGDQGVVSRD